MLDKLKEIWSKIVEWWNKFTTKQKTIIVSVSAGVIFLFAIIIFVISRPQYTFLTKCDSAADASEVVAVLDENQIAHKESSDGKTISVDSNKISQANLALGTAGILSSGFSLADFVGSSMTTTSAVQQLQYKEYLEKKIANDILKGLDAVKTCTVNLDIPKDNGTLIASKEEASAWIQLDLAGTFTSQNAANLAKSVATWLKTSTSKVTIMDQDATLLFAGSDEYSFSSAANTMQELQNQAEAMTAKKVKTVLLGTKQFDNVNVSGFLNVDYSEYQKTIKEYSSNDGTRYGMIVNQDLYSDSNEGTGGAVPGTDSNDETVYYSPDYGNSSSESSQSHTEYAPNESILYQNTVAGCIDYKNSSITVAMISYNEIHEEDVKRLGLLDSNTSWEEYKLLNGNDVKLTVDEDYYRMVSNATGIPADKISILAFESPIFYDKAPLDVSWTNVLSGVILVAILGLLAFVIIRNMRADKADEEEEISVENLLQSTPESEIDNIDVEAKSEKRKMVEKFVDENPEAVALLLRNWLNDEWG